MQILGINHILKWVQIVSGGKKYTCPIKEINEELLFKFKNEWHKVVSFISEHTHEFK